MNYLRNPDLYHNNKKVNFFEGWYYKIVDKNNTHCLAFIPGISYGSTFKKSESFIQVLNSFDLSYNYYKFNTNDFIYKTDKLHINIKNNEFTLSNMTIDIDTNDTIIKGNLLFKNIKKWPDTFLNPGSMGFFNYLNFLECYSQVCVIDGDIIGSLLVNDNSIDFTGGKIYIEKNWGKKFPKSWIWIQSNSFPNNNASVTCSLAKIPFPLKDFRGFIIGVLIDNKFYEFSTLNRSKLIIKDIGNDIELVAIKNNLKLILNTYNTANKFVLCKGPKDGEMIPLVKETLLGKVHMILEDTKSNKTIFEGVGQCTGVEYGGEYINIIG